MTEKDHYCRGEMDRNGNKRHRKKEEEMEFMSFLMVYTYREEFIGKISIDMNMQIKSHVSYID
jgi:hypothetical protein